MSKLSELKSVEAPVAEWLSKLGWQEKTPEEMKQFNRPLSSPIVEAILVEKIKELNNISESDAKRAYDILVTQFISPDLISSNEQFLSLLNSGIALTIKNEDTTIRLIDFDEIWNNSFIVTRQYWVQHKKPDVVLLVNGIPLVCIEAKQRARKGVNWLEGVNQFATYQDEAPKLYVCNAFGVACNGRIAKYGSVDASASYFFEWKELSVNTQFDNPILDPKNKYFEIEEKEGIKYLKIDVIERMKQNLVGQLQPAKVLDILRNFIVFERTQDSGIVKKVARYQQYRAANKMVDRVAKTDLKTGIIWHTQGSGKSLTMLYTAYKLRTNEDLKNPTVYIVVDRKDLRTQIGDTFEDCEFPNTSRPANIKQLKHKISTGPAEVIITNIQKFRELGNVKDARDNVIVLVDEAHRSQYGDFHSELLSVLPKCKRFAFTGTPIPRTQKVFGAKKEGKFEPYLDQYSMIDSIRDEATVAIRYSFGKQEWFLDKEKLKQGFDEITKELDEEQRRVVQKRVQPWKVFMKKQERIEALAKDVGEDFRAIVEPNGFKAQLVAVDKEACVLYYNELIKKKYFDPSEIAIVFSETPNEVREKHELYKDHYLTDGELKTLLKKFRRRITPEEQKNGNNIKMLIVCNMLLTGFDAPIEQTMYFDSPLKDHNLLQAIARTNRPYEDKITKIKKEFGRIVDYVGVFRYIDEALDYDPNDIGEFPDVDSLAKEFPSKVEEALSPFKGIKLEDSYECSIAIIRILTNIDQIEFEKSFRGVVQLYEAISPHPIIIQCLARYRWLLTIYEMYLEEFKRLDFDAEFYAAKTRKLIQESAKMINFKRHLPEVTIDDKYIDNLGKTKLSPEDKAEKIIRDLETVIRRNELENPVFEDFAKRLQKIVDKKKAEADSIEKILKELEHLYSEVDEVASLPQRMGFPDRGSFDVYTEIMNKKSGLEKELVKKFSCSLIEEFQPKIYPGWQDYEQELKRLRTDIKLLMSDDEYAELGLTDDSDFITIIVKRLVQHYGWD